MALVFLVLLIPFVVTTNFFFPFITGKAFAFRIIVEIVFALWLILALREPAYRPRFSWLGAAFAVFLVVMGIADLMSPNPMKSFWSNFERMEGFITLLHLFAYFLVASAVLNSEKWWTRFFQTSVGISVAMGIYGILQLAGKIAINQGGVRLDGTLGNATYLAVFMLLNFFFALFLLVRSRKVVYWRWIYGAIMALQLFIIYETETRGAVIGLFAGTVVWSLLISLGTRNEKILRRIALGILAVCIVVPTLFFFLRNQPFIHDNSKMARYAALADSLSNPSLACEGEFKSRCHVWPMAWKGFLERPITGWGQESFNYVFNKYYDPRMYTQEQWFDRTHNVALDWLIAGGALGLLSYLALFAFALFYVWRQGEHSFSVGSLLKRIGTLWKGHELTHFPEKAILTGLLVAYFIYNLSVFDNITSYILFFMLLAYIHSISHWPSKRIQETKLNADMVVYVWTPLTVLVIGFVMYTSAIIPMRASATLINALQSKQEGVGKNLELFKKALAYNTFGNAEIREQLAQKSIEVLNAQSVPLDVKQQFYDLAHAELTKQIKQTPNDARYYLFLGSFLDRARNYDEAVTALKNAIELSPKKQMIMFALASAYVHKHDYVNAEKVTKEAFDLEPNFTESRIIYATTAIYAKDFSLATALLGGSSDTATTYDERIVQAYAAVGKFDIVVSLLEKRLEDTPLDFQARLSLAGAYLNNSQRTKAVAVLRTAAKDFPDQADQIDYYVREIQAGRNP